ncbi:prenylated rab acceptor PRA1 [Polychytrium aggregatum]|uniref:prenylated rab acceptor PRA1 n=1 Tax=Polychytrium aggregatum TaxID=110093 RepID=UPI0022FE5166|nr:prenylated rab acceptor PRA1 [Polychytrium aggregatum]KAI9206025.1 prenylated rab acceptor PRA1 [Polychytrium aggregatum]
MLRRSPPDNSTLENLKETSRSRLNNIKPFSDFFDRNRFNKPASFAVFSQRVSFNLQYFQNNYLLIVLVFTAYSLITNLLFFISSVLLAFGFRYVSSMPANEPARLFGGKVALTQTQSYIGLAVLTLLTFWLTDAFDIIFWLVVGAGIFIVGHAGFMEPPVENDFAETV